MIAEFCHSQPNQLLQISYIQMFRHSFQHGKLINTKKFTKLFFDFMIFVFLRHSPSPIMHIPSPKVSPHNKTVHLFEKNICDLVVRCWDVNIKSADSVSYVILKVFLVSLMQNLERNIFLDNCLDKPGLH